MSASALHVIFTGIISALTLHNLLLTTAGVFIGIVAGAIPGLNGPMAIAISIPLTFTLSPLTAIAYLVGINKGACFGGSISAILINVPGTAEAMATTFDGYPLARQGKPLKAMKMALYASVIGDTFSDLVLIAVAAPFAIAALAMGPAEITALMMFALTFIAAVVGKSMPKGLIAAALGIFVSTVGLDPEASTPRMTFGLIDLEDGIPLLAMVIGMLALSEIMIQIEEHVRAKAAGLMVQVNAFDKNVPHEDRIITIPEFKSCLRTIFRSAVIGTVIGAIPGLGATLAGFLGYGAAKRASKNPQEFGNGAIEGIAAAESANSATAGANLIPTLALGIPGNLSAAILLSALIIHNLTPGPMIFKQHGVVLYGLFTIMVLANGINLFIGQLGLRLFAWVISLPYQYILPVIVLLCFSGTYLITQSMFSVGLMVAFGIIGYVMRKLDYSTVAFLIAFILGPLFEDSLRQTLVLFGDTPMQLLHRPIALFFVAVTVYALWRIGFRSKPKALREP